MSEDLLDKDNNQVIDSQVADDNKIDYQKQAADYLAGWQRARADYQNLQKETEQKLGSLAMWAHQEVILELLPLVDYFKHAFKHLPVELKGSEWVDGIRHIQSRLEQALAYFGVKEMEVIGEKFNPQFHEAIGEVSDSGQEAGLIVEELRTGFLWRDEVLQAARVKIAK